jgi:hypothetical protein
MNKNKILIAFLLIILASAVIFVSANFFFKQKALAPVVETPLVSTSTELIYKNDAYSFTMNLQKDWTGYSASTSAIKFGNSVTLRHPLWTKENPRMDIPVLVYTVEQWDKWVKTDFEGYPTASPIGPTERGRNIRYVFATAPRYNFSFLTGFEGVEDILKTLKGY